MKLITYKGETHTFTEWCKILRSQPDEDDIPRFVQDLEPGMYSNAALYQLYSMYSDNPVPKYVFEKRVVRAFQNFRPIAKRYKTRSERGWYIGDGNSAVTADNFSCHP